MSPKPAAPRSASVRAWATTSASECPASPCRWGTATPPRINFRRSANRCESYPMPTRISDLEDSDRQVGGVFGVVDTDAGHRHTARDLRGGEQRVEAVERPHRERHPDHRQIGERGGEPGERGRESGAGDDHPEPPSPGTRHQLGGLLRLAVRRGYVELIRNARLVEDLEGGLDTR